MWLSPPSAWIGSAMKQAMSCGCCAEGRLGLAHRVLLAADNIVEVLASGKVIAGTSIRGQSELREAIGLHRVGVGSDSV
jgi:hypothetical protein